MEERNLRKTRTGRVVSNKMDKTIVVANLNNLSAYSKKLRVYKKVTELMEVLLNG